MLLAALALFATGAPLALWPVDSLIKVFPDDPAGKNRAVEQAWLVPRNGHVSIQFAVRSPGRVPAVTVALKPPAGLETKVRRVGYVPVGTNPPRTPFDEVLRAAPALYPDPLLEDFPFPLEAGRTEAIWITVRAPASVLPGVYTGELKLLVGEKPLATASFRVRVAAVTVPERQTLKVTNWFTLGEAALGRFYKLENQPERYWELLENLGRVMAEHRQNVILTPVKSLTAVSLKDGALAYDFSRLDRWVQTFQKAGLIGTIEGGHLLGRASGYHSALVIPAWVIEDGKAVERRLEADDPRAEAFFSSFLPALYAHLKEKGWADRYIQHIHDEPHGAENPIYERYAKVIRKHLPGVPTIDAVSLDQDIGFFRDVCDIWTPVLGSFDRRLEMIRSHVERGGQAWFYTCISPQGRYLNRFIDYSLVKVRLLHWFNYRHQFTGFLHWGGNYWGPTPFLNVQTVINDNRTLLPAGDNAIVYPYPEKNTVLSSIRLEAMREGIEDYELLAALGKADPARTRELAQAAIPNINDYVRDAASFRRLQAKLLGVGEALPSVLPPRPPPGPPPLASWFVDSLTKVFPDDRPGPGPAVFDAARRSNVSIQLVLRAPRTLGDIYVDALPLAGPGAPIDTIRVRWVEYVVVTSNTPGTPEEELVRKAPALYPDALMEEFPITLRKNETRSIWLTVSVPAGQAPGEYKGRLRVRQGTEELARIPYAVRVHEATVPARIPLAIANHFTFADERIRQFYACSRFTEEWWELVANFARFLAGYHQNSIVADPVGLASAKVEGGELRYDFGNFERFVQTFQAAGVSEYIEGGNLLTRERRPGAPVMLRAWVVEDGRPAQRTLPYADPAAQRFLASWLPALHRLLEQRGWTKKYLQGVLDEPRPGEHEAFAETAAAVRRLMPGVRMMEPVGAKQDLGFMEPVEIWCPQLGSFDEERLKALRAHAERGGELWFYTALTPRGKYPNRFIDYSLVKVRLLHWMNFRYGFRGFLHWGGNYWGPEPFKDTQPVINLGRTYLPPGDAYITYPNRLRRSLYSSIRLEQMREGIEDFALLEELKKKDPARAAKLAGDAVASFTEYVREPKRFREIQRALLE
ncbi:MAG: DUF4091 domain-containing protein [Acidobacteriota bacterium]